MSTPLWAKTAKVSKSEDDAIKAKFEPRMKEAQKKMMDAIMKATTSGKKTPADLAELGKEMQVVAQSMTN